MLDNLNSNFESSKAQRPDANDDEVEIDLLEIFYALKKKILLVLMVALAGGCIAAAYTQFLMTPIYSSTSSILVLSKETTLTSLADLQLGASLTSDYTVLITSTPVMEQVISDLNLDMTAEQLKESVSINNPTDTRILEITVNNTDSKMAKKISASWISTSCRCCRSLATRFPNSAKRFFLTLAERCGKFTKKKSRSSLKNPLTACIIPIRTLTH